jgi:hypothetical protein
VAEDTERRWRQREAFDFYAAKHHVVSLAGLAALDLERQPLVAASGPHYGWQEGQSALAGDLQHGWSASFGLLSLAMAKAYGIEGKVYAGFFAILPEKLVAASAARKRYADFSLQPAALRDLALVVPAATVASEVQKALAKAARAAVGRRRNHVDRGHGARTASTAGRSATVGEACEVAATAGHEAGDATRAAVPEHRACRRRRDHVQILRVQPTSEVV